MNVEPSTAKKLLILGLDGATLDVLGPLMAEGRMMRLKALVASGASGILRSTTPPITPAAWTTFLTGCQPGSHGIIDFERYDVFENRLKFNSTVTLGSVRHLWQLLSDCGLRVGSINVPMTYPAFPVNGFLISGFETPSHEGDFVYPTSLKADILQRFPDPTLKMKWQRSWWGSRRVFQKNLDYIARSFFQGVEMTRYCGRRFGWDALMVVLKLVDNLQHKTWKYLDSRWAKRHPWQHERVKQVFEKLDEAIGQFVDYAGEHDASTLIISDHGHGSLEGKVQPNLLLKHWGYLSLKGGGARGAARSRTIGDRLLSRRNRFTRVSDLERDLAVDFSRTTACVMHAGMAGFLYINLKDRQPCGIVPTTEYEALRDELRERLLSETCLAPDGKEIRLFPEVHKPEQLYSCRRKDQPWLPDLMLIPHESLAVVRKIRGSAPVRWLPWRRIEGTHRPDGIVMVSGDGIAKRGDLRLHIADCAPTILAMLGLKVPAEMDGRVATEVFEKPPTVVIEKEASKPSTAISFGEPVSQPSSRVHPSTVAEDQAYSEEDLAKVTERLADLGYLE